MMASFFAEAGKEEFKQIQQWNHGDQELYNILFLPIITNEGNIILRDGRQSGSYIISPTKVVKFAPSGQGPSDLYLPASACNYGEDIAYIGFTKKIKIFTKKGNTYTWKETKSLKSPYYLIPMDMLFHKGKWFFAGNYVTLDDRKKERMTFFYLSVFSDKGEPLKGLISRNLPYKEDHAQMDYFLELYRNRVFLMIENELKVFEIDPDEIKVLREIKLETPGFYKKMPPDFYILEETPTDGLNFVKTIENWKLSYSSITGMAVDNGYLAVQVRTCSDKLKKYALLFYNADTFKLEKIFFSNDFFFGASKGKYYFYANGNPGYDEEAEECIINLYSFKEEVK
ncbi:MAG: hypothetical protein PVH61_41535 [Candidatus Aminicenantes bacterium]